jgi:hypothetical protein
MREGEREGTEVREKTPDALAIARRHNKRGPGGEERGTRGEGGEPRKGVGFLLCVAVSMGIIDGRLIWVERGRERGGGQQKKRRRRRATGSPVVVQSIVGGWRAGGCGSGKLQGIAVAPHLRHQGLP